MTCDKCGYHPRESDKHTIVMNDGTEYSYDIIHVICYQCGYEWVE